MVVGPVGKPIPAIKLERTDTTLDLSLMAKEAGERGKQEVGSERARYLYTVVS
jgi:hypothetical protein